MFKKFSFYIQNRINFCTSFPLLTRTDWSKTRTKVNQPTCFIPRYLLDGSLRKGHGRSGRNSNGKITTRHRGGFCKQNYRIIDFLRVPYDKNAKSHSVYKDEVIGIAYDPCRSSLIAKVAGNISQRYRLVLAATGMKIGDIITYSRGNIPPNHKLAPGDTFPLKYFPISSTVYNVESYPGSGGKFIRQGDFSAVISRNKTINARNVVTLKVNDRLIELDGDCLASYGQTRSNGLKYLPLGKAGRARRYGKKMKGKTGFLRLRNKRQKGRKNLKTFRLR